MVTIRSTLKYGLLALIFIFVLRANVGAENMNSKDIYYNTNNPVIVYINWDGFAKYYYDLANQETSLTPVINSLLKEGVFFNDMTSGIPSVTNPMQTSILTGAWPNTTGNTGKYYNRALGKVVSLTRENNSENMAQAIKRQGMLPASVNQFVLESRREDNIFSGSKYYDKGCTSGDKTAPYYNGGKNYVERFDTAIDIVRKTPPNGKALPEKFPNFLAIYIDDLDALGHNEKTNPPSYDGIMMASTEEGRLSNVLQRMSLMDAKLGEFIQACKDVGIYENITFILATDHGMTPFGMQSGEKASDLSLRMNDFYNTYEQLSKKNYRAIWDFFKPSNFSILTGFVKKYTDKYTYSKFNEIKKIFDKNKIKAEFIETGGSPKKSTDAVLVGSGQQLQISFVKPLAKEKITHLVKDLQVCAFVDVVMSKEELIVRGAADEFADILISPKSPYHFRKDLVSIPYIARGHHDSLGKTSQNVFTLVWGKNIRKGIVYDEKAYIIDIIPSVSQACGIDAPLDSTGAILNIAEKKE